MNISALLSAAKFFSTAAARSYEERAEDAYETWADTMVTMAELRIPKANGRMVSVQTLHDIIRSLPKDNRIRMRAAILITSGYGEAISGA